MRGLKATVLDTSVDYALYSESIRSLIERKDNVDREAHARAHVLAAKEVGDGSRSATCIQLCDVHPAL
jgi:hypothetical protein